MCRYANINERDEPHAPMDTVRLFRPWPSLRFHYGTMEAGKSLELLIAAHQLRQKNVKYIVFSATPSIGSNNCETKVSSRSGIPPHTAIIIGPDMTVPQTCLQSGFTHILIDEAQFLSQEQIGLLREFVEADASNRVDCYGLKTDFKGEFFPGSLELMRCADELIEVPSMCSRCTRPATHNMRLDAKGNAINSGDQVALKESTTYVAVCYSCWNKAMSSIE